jgi:hypothetical protein
MATAAQQRRTQITDPKRRRALIVPREHGAYCSESKGFSSFTASELHGPVEIRARASDTDIVMQLRGNKVGQAKEARDLTALKRGESGVLDRIDLPEDDARR